MLKEWTGVAEGAGKRTSSPGKTSQLKTPTPPEYALVGWCFRCDERRLFRFINDDRCECFVCEAPHGIPRQEGPDSSLKRYHRDAMFKFWSRVKVTEYCWPWVAKTYPTGPQWKVDGKIHKAARVAFYFAYGRWPNGVAFRKCGNIHCCRPEHILDIQSGDISRKLSVMGRKKNEFKQWPRRRLCKRGHRLTGHNAAPQNRGKGRYCRKCNNMNMRRRRAEARAARG